MPRHLTAAARVWVGPEFRLADTLPPYPAPPGSWEQLFAAIEVEAAERALKAVRTDLSAWRKTDSGRSDGARAAFDEVVHRIDTQIEIINAFAWADGPRPEAIEDLYLDALRTLHRELEIAGARGGASIADLRKLAVWTWAVFEESGQVARRTPTVHDSPQGRHGDEGKA